MSKINNPDNKYKKMSAPPKRTAKKSSVLRQKGASGGSSKKNRTQNRDSQNSSGTAQKKKLNSLQLVIIFLLSFISLILLVLIFFMFQPGKIQLWNIPQNEKGPAVVHRLDPVIDESALKPESDVLKEAVQPEKPVVEDKTANTRIYFVKVNTEGQISLKSVTRSVDFSKSPLTQTINTLLNGPGSDEINKGSLTLIPEGSRLLSARVEGGTAYLNFNEAFRFNPLGREGYTAQLKQVVYTSTEFASIQNVQILIEGVIREYLGGEGFYIGEPLSRESFQNNL